MAGRRTAAGWAALAALVVGVAGCSGTSGSPAASSSTGAGSAGSADASSVETFDAPPQGRDWVVLVDHPKETGRVATDLEDAGLTLTSSNSGVGMITLRSTSTDVAKTAKGVDGVADVATDRRVGWSPQEEPPSPTTGDQTLSSDHPAPPDASPGGDPFDGWLWGMDEIKVPGAHEVTTGRAAVRVGVIDSGIDGEHPDLAPVLDTEASRSFVTDIPDIDGACEHADCVDPVGVDDSGHGTHVAGTIAAAANGLGVTGVAPGVTLVDLRAGQDAGLVLLGPTVNALTHAADERLDVVNMSFYVDPWLYACAGGAKGDTAEQVAAQDVTLELMDRALALTHERGVTLVTAAGNSGMDVADPGTDETSPNYGDDPRPRSVDPAQCHQLPLDGEHVIGVASTDEGGARSTFSNWTSDPDDDRIDLAAPGGEESDGHGGILSAAPRELLRTQGFIDDAGRVTKSGADGTVRDCPGGIAPGDPDPKQRCGYYAWMQGTSMAAPHVSGVAALIISAHGQRMDPVEVATRLTGTAHNRPCTGGAAGSPRQSEGDAGETDDADAQARCVGTTGRNGFFGAGMLDAAAAVR